MATPSYGGSAIFGLEPVIVVQENPRAQQIDGFFGVNGVERKDGGARGRVALARGRLRGLGEAALAGQLAAWHAFNDGFPRALVDTLGRSWPGMKLVRFNEDGEAMAEPGGWYSRQYQAEFESAL